MVSILKRDRVTHEWPDWFARVFDWPEPFSEDRLMKVEELEEDGTMIVRAELPGIDPDKDVEITVEDGYLRLRAERREETKEEDTRHFRSEFRYGSFVRTLPLAPGCTEDDVEASYKDGILEVRIPLDHAKAEARKIPITRT